MAQDEDVFPHLDGRVPDGLDPFGGLRQRHGRLRADRPARGQAHVGYQHVSAGLGHLHRLFLVEDVGAGEQPGLVGFGDHLHLQVVSHVRFFQVLAEQTVNEPDRGEVLHAGEALVLQLLDEDAHDAEGIRAAYACQHGGVLHDGQDLLSHFHHDLVGVAVGHHAGERTAPGHAVAPGVVDDDDVGASRLSALRGKPGAGPRADYRSAFGYLRPQPPQAFVIGYGHGLLRMGIE